MDNILRDVHRLGLIMQINVGQERFSPVMHFADFSRYYFSRFVNNLTHAFKDFSSSQIKDFNARHKDKLAELTSRPGFASDKTIVPIPRGMVNSYRETLDRLLEVMGIIHADTIEHDLTQILNTMGTAQLKTIVIDQLDAKSFEDAKAIVAKLFGKTGLSHSTSGHVLATPDDLVYVNQKLLSTVGHYYPIVLTLNSLLKKIEIRFDQLKFSEADKEVMSHLLMTMAYRLSILAVVMDNVQGIEHGFVGTVNQILKHN